MPTDKIITHTEGGVGWLTFNNPERLNAMSRDMWLAVSEAMDLFSADDSVRVVVMKGAGERAFVSGADISEFEQSRNSAEAEAEYAKLAGDAFQKLGAFEKPLIAMIQGYCIGGGLAVALCADLRIASTDSVFAIPAAKLGLGYGFDEVKTLVDLVGPSTAKNILFTARKFSADDAFKMGLVNQVVAIDGLEQAVADCTDPIGENAPLTIRAAKRAVSEVLREPADRDLGFLNDMINACFDSADFQEGRAAFMEKRKPVFKGH